MMHPKKEPTTKSWLRWLLVSSFAMGLVLSNPSQGCAEEKAEFYEQIYLSETQALKTVFGNLRVQSRPLPLNEIKRKEIQRILRRKIPEQEFTLFEGYDGKQIKRYAFILDEKGKHFPITFIVALKPDSSVQQVAVMVYRERRGEDVKRQRFLNQFVNKNRTSEIEINKDIVHLTGATISSWSIAAGVRKAVVLLDELVLKP